MFYLSRSGKASFFLATLAILVTPWGAFAEEKANAETHALLKIFRSEFVDINPGKGKFPAKVSIGSRSGPKSEQPVQEVILTKDFAISKYETYQNLYEAVMGNNPSRWKGERNSAERMTYEEAKQFCSKVTKLLIEHKLIQPEQVVRLPTEQEWEYCTRAGTTTAYSFGENAQSSNDAGNKASKLDPYAWHTGNAAGNDPEVGVLKPNSWGLYDVHGYLWEYCLDDWKLNHAADAKSDETKATIRGGSWKDHYSRLTSSARVAFPKTGRDDAVGFRCLLTEEE